MRVLESETGQRMFDVDFSLDGTRLVISGFFGDCSTEIWQRVSSCSIWWNLGLRCPESTFLLMANSFWHPVSMA